MLTKHGLPDDDPGLKAYFHRHAAQLDEAIEAARNAKTIEELRIITSKFPDATTRRVAQVFSDVLVQGDDVSRQLKREFDRIQTAIREAADKITDPAKRAKALETTTEDLRRLESKLAQRGHRGRRPAVRAGAGVAWHGPPRRRLA